MPKKRTPGRGERATSIALAVGAAIKEARTRAGLSQTALAAQIGMSRQLYTDIEAGRVPPRVDQLDAIATGCNASPTTIVRRSIDLLDD